MKIRAGYELGLKCIVSILGCAAMVSTLMTAMNIDYGVSLEVVSCILLPTLFVCIFSLKKRYKYMAMGVVAGLVLIFIGVKAVSIISGVRYLYNDFIRSIEQTNASIVYTYISEESDKMVAVLAFTIISAIITSVVVVYLRSFVAALISILPLLVLFVGFLLIPATGAFVLCILYTLAVAAMYGRHVNIASTTGVLCMTTVIAVLLCIFLDTDDYKRPDMFYKLQMKITSIVEQYTDVNLGGTVSGTTTSNGDLGKTDKISYDYVDVATITTISTGHSQYIRQFIGKNYTPYTNKWTESTYGSADTQYTQLMFSYIDRNSALRSVLRYSDDSEYFNEYLMYKVTFKLINSSSNSTESYAFSVRSGDYSVFNSSKLSNNNNQSDYENNISSYYTEVPEITKSVLRNLLGDAFFSGYTDELTFAEKVREYLADNYVYSLSPGAVPDGEDFVSYFLTENKKGYCTYFATAAAMMLRYAGIPTRYCEGYVVTDAQVTAGTRTLKSYVRYKVGGSATSVTYDTYTLNIEDSQAHAWVEVFIKNYGWVPVEMTPGYSEAELAFTDGNGSASTSEQPTASDDTSDETDDAKSTTAEDVEGEDASYSTDDGTAITDANGNPIDDTSDDTDSNSDSNNDSNRKDEGVGSGADDASEDSNRSWIDRLLWGSDDESGDGSDNGDGGIFGSDGLVPTLEKIGSRIKGFLVVLLVILLLIGALTIRWLVATNHHKKLLSGTELLNRQRVIKLYLYLDQLLGALGYKKEVEVDYEEYTNHIVEDNEVLRLSGLTETVGIALKARFATEDINDDEVNRAAETVKQVRKYVMDKSNLVKRIWFAAVRGL